MVDYFPVKSKDGTMLQKTAFKTVPLGGLKLPLESFSMSHQHHTWIWLPPPDQCTDQSLTLAIQEEGACLELHISVADDGRVYVNRYFVVCLCVVHSGGRDRGSAGRNSSGRAWILLPQQEEKTACHPVWPHCQIPAPTHRQGGRLAG